MPSHDPFSRQLEDKAREFFQELAYRKIHGLSISQSPTLELSSYFLCAIRYQSKRNATGCP